MIQPFKSLFPTHFSYRILNRNSISVVFLALLLSSGCAKTDSEPLRAALASTRFVAYTPTDLKIIYGQVKPASKDQITRDLTVLRNDFQGLITYSCADGLEHLPAIAKSLGYTAIILGIWDPMSEEELTNAKKLVNEFPDLIVGISVGNENLLAKRYDWDQLKQAMRKLRSELPGTPVATSEPFYYYLNDEPADFIAEQDFLLPSIHPLFQPWFEQGNTTSWVNFVVEVMNLLIKKSDKLILIKESGLPSGPKGSRFSPEQQADFWVELYQKMPHTPGLNLAYFEGFDHAWKEENAKVDFKGAHPEEGYWGFYTEAGQPKPVLKALRKLWQSTAQSQEAPR
ncbi:hypothetical protein [Methylicorpusculum sp.]|uniref:hypothetical protein n=1 Tax=Methylicorpusculum sp. TaxID=2713644 RepID=UPI00271D9707|nr:hypothetical protein [Methylicorpusculum sp.]MDO8843874.1 hypothetical protein [Methylicorpusculum sp.]